MTQGQTSVREFTDAYIEQCFTVWYSSGQPTNMQILQDAVPETPEGRKPGIQMLRQLRDTYGWNERADVLNVKAIEVVEHQLIDQKATMLKRQAEQALQIADKARDHLLKNGFDTSSSAVSALFKATEEERTVRGVSEMMIKISKMSPEELMQEAAKLLKRNSEVIEGETTEEDADISSYPT
jgi:hypothetical protein